jgi:hypothetical protein
MMFFYMKNILIAKPACGWWVQAQRIGELNRSTRAVRFLEPTFTLGIRRIAVLQRQTVSERKLTTKRIRRLCCPALSPPAVDLPAPFETHQLPTDSSDEAKFSPFDRSIDLHTVTCARSLGLTRMARKESSVSGVSGICTPGQLKSARHCLEDNPVAKPCAEQLRLALPRDPQIVHG